jgi:hypothetical protein
MGLGSNIMSEQPASPPGLQVFATRVYFDPKNGEVVETHQLVGAAGEPLSPRQIEAEMADFEGKMRERHPGIDFIVVDEQELQTSAKGMLVDVENRSIVWPVDNGG